MCLRMAFSLAACSSHCLSRAVTAQREEVSARAELTCAGAATPRPLGRSAPRLLVWRRFFFEPRSTCLPITPTVKG